jgi:microcystin degradation protein MlrC
MARIAIVGYQHESNSFSKMPASLAKWEDAGILRGDAIRTEYEKSKATIAGFYQRIGTEKDIDLVPLIFARLMPMGPIDLEATEYLFNEMLYAIRNQGPWDAILLPLHGAAVSDRYQDTDGEFTRQVRQIVGPKVVIGTALDMHANVSQLIVDNSDVLTTYQTNPHTDCDNQGFHCADLVLRTIRGEIKPTMHLCAPPLVANILKQGTNDEPMASILAKAEELRSQAGILSISVVLGYPYADVPHMGMTFIAITQNDSPLAKSISTQAANAAWARRESLQGTAISAQDAMKQIRNHTSFPIIMFDVGDNVGAGTPGDSTIALHAARANGISGVLQALCDPEMVAFCQEYKVGEYVEIEVGAKFDDMHGTPISIRGKITAFSDGKYEEENNSHGGFRYFDDGPSVAIQTEDDLKILLTSKSAMSSSLEQFRRIGIEPKNAKVIIVKGVHSPRAVYEKIAGELIWLNTDGASTANLFSFPYKNRRKPLYPFEADITWD